MSRAAAIVAIVGATATGKTALAVKLAPQLDGEIINLDSRQLYRGMDIGTAKPTAVEQASARHWLIDVADPDEQLTLANVLDLARAALSDIVARGKLPIIAGGTGQYVWALLEDWQVPRVAPDPVLREELKARVASVGVEALVQELRALDPVGVETIDMRNPRRLIRAIEVSRATGRPYSETRTKGGAAHGAMIIGLRIPREALYTRIDQRVDAMIASGLVDEVRALNAAGYGCDLRTMSGIGYRQVCEHLRGERSLPDAIARMKTETHRLARMQHAWFSAEDARIHWIDSDPDPLDAALAFVRAAQG